MGFSEYFFQMPLICEKDTSILSKTPNFMFLLTFYRRLLFVEDILYA